MVCSSHRVRPAKDPSPAGRCLVLFRSNRRRPRCRASCPFGMVVTVSLLYSPIACPHPVTMDLFADPAERDDISPIVRMLWERGTLHAQAIISGVGTPAHDLSIYRGDEKERLTTEAIECGEALIYSGRIRADDLLGEPDLLRRRGAGYIAGDIKSGAGLEGSEYLSKPKVQCGAGPALHRNARMRGLQGLVGELHSLHFGHSRPGSSLRSLCIVRHQEPDPRAAS